MLVVFLGLIGTKVFGLFCLTAGLATNSVSFFQKKSLICLEGNINDPSSGKYDSLPFLPANPMALSQTIEGLFELTSRALDSPYALPPELQRNKDSVWCVTLGAEVPGHRQQQLMQTLIVRL